MPVLHCKAWRAESLTHHLGFGTMRFGVRRAWLEFPNAPCRPPRAGTPGLQPLQQLPDDRRPANQDQSGTTSSTATLTTAAALTTTAAPAARRRGSPGNAALLISCLAHALVLNHTRLLAASLGQRNRSPGKSKSPTWSHRISSNWNLSSLCKSKRPQAVGHRQLPKRLNLSRC